MLPSGKLSLHGYTVTSGFFSGTCRGSKYEPFETSCALVERFVREAQISLKTLEAFQASLRQPATEPIGWVHNYERFQSGRTGYVWRQVAIEASDRGFSYMAPGTGYKVAPGTAIRHDFGFSDYYGVADALAMATKKNTEYAKALEREAQSLRAYIAWQTERVRTWKATELTPLTGKIKDDKQGFNPEGK